VDRSRRRSTVVAWVTAVVVAFGGTTFDATPALADEPGVGSSGSVPVPASGTDGASGSDGTSGLPGASGAGVGESIPSRGGPIKTPRGPIQSDLPPGRGAYGCVGQTVDQCPRSSRPEVTPRSGNSGGGIGIGVPVLPSFAPPVTVGSQRAVEGGRDLELSLPPLSPSQSAPGDVSEVAPALGTPPTAAGVDGPRAPAPIAPIAPVLSPPLPGQLVFDPPQGAVANPGTTPAVPAPAQAPREAEPMIPAPQVSGPETPAELRAADLGRVASAALPGLGVLGAVMLLGGLIGYRQARAGYQFRLAGAGRFLQ
jgi:hypothetical protein